MWSTPFGVSCGVSCSGLFVVGEPLTLHASATTGKFVGWSQACSGSAATCSLAMSSDRSVTANFSSDTTAPAATMQPVTLRTGVQVDQSGALPVVVHWTASNGGGSGIDHFDVERSLNGGAFVHLATLPAGTLSYSTTLDPAGTVVFRVRAVDAAANIGAWKITPSLQPRLDQETAESFTGAWASASAPQRHWAAPRSTRRRQMRSRHARSTTCVRLPSSASAARTAVK